MKKKNMNFQIKNDEDEHELLMILIFILWQFCFSFFNFFIDEWEEKKWWVSTFACVAIVKVSCSLSSWSFCVTCLNLGFNILKLKFVHIRRTKCINNPKNNARTHEKTNSDNFTRFNTYKFMPLSAVFSTKCGSCENWSLFFFFGR